MSISRLLEDFNTTHRGATLSISDTSFEEQRLEAYENGYKAGWDDAVAAQGDDANRVSSDFANNLQHLSFTYEEAATGVLKNLRPLFDEMIRTVLPRIAHDTLGLRVADLLEQIAKDNARGPVELVTAIDNAAALTSLTEGFAAMPVTVTPEPSLGDGQVHIRFGESERDINLDQVLTDITTAVASFFDASSDIHAKDTA